MNRILMSFFCLAVLMVDPQVRGQDADAGNNELPLYREFRALSGLPWKEAGSTRKTVLERILHDPHALARNEILREYVQTALPAEEFSAAFDECIALEAADFPGAPVELVMRAWAERDPAAAIERCETLFDLVIEGAPLGFDAWSRPIRTGDLEKLRASKYWFGSRDVVHACWKGLAAATLTPARRKELEEEFTAAYSRRFQQTPPKNVEEPAQMWGAQFQPYVDHPTIFTNAGLRTKFLGLLAAPPEEIPGTLQWPREPGNDLLFSGLLVRWMDGDGKKAPQIVDRVLNAYDPRHFYGEDAEQVVPTELLVEWAILDRAGFMGWTEEKRRGPRARAIYLAVMPKEKPIDYDVQPKIGALPTTALNSECNRLWIMLDPGSALPRLSRQGEESDISAAVDDLRSSETPGNYWRRFVAPYASLYHHSGDSEAWGVTTLWGRVDFRAMVKKYGLPWCLHSGGLKESQVTGGLANRQPMESDLRNTLSALRTWATVRPKEMRAWIDGEKFAPDLREALLWLLDNAQGGFAVPAPVEAR